MTVVACFLLSLRRRRLALSCVHVVFGTRSTLHVARHLVECARMKAVVNAVEANQSAVHMQSIGTETRARIRSTTAAEFRGVQSVADRDTCLMDDQWELSIRARRLYSWRTHSVTIRGAATHTLCAPLLPWSCIVPILSSYMKGRTSLATESAVTRYCTSRYHQER